MQCVRGMEKNSRVGTGGSAYDGTKDSDVKKAFNEAMANNGLCILPISIEDETEITRWTEDTKWGVKQKQSVFTKVKTKYLLIHDSGESIELAGYGHGVDPQDKSAGKALTYALKNTILYSFLTPVGKIDDSDTTHSDEIESPKPQPEPVSKPASKPVTLPKKSNPRDVLAERIEADKDAHWFEVVAWQKGKHAGATLGQAASAGDVAAIKELLDYIDPVALDHETAVKRLKEALTEATTVKAEIDKRSQPADAKTDTETTGDVDAPF